MASGLQRQEKYLRRGKPGRPGTETEYLDVQPQASACMLGPSEWLWAETKEAGTVEALPMDLWPCSPQDLLWTNISIPPLEPRTAHSKASLFPLEGGPCLQPLWVRAGKTQNRAETEGTFYVSLLCQVLKQALGPKLTHPLPLGTLVWCW